MGGEEEKEDAEYRMGGRGISALGLRTQLDSKRAHNPLHPKHSFSLSNATFYTKSFCSKNAFMADRC